jgi:hypothetical protein
VGEEDVERQVPAWMRVSPPRVRVWDRVQERLQAEERDPARDLGLRPGFEGVWTRLLDPTLHRPFRITCWRMLHGCLGCGAFLAHVRRTGLPYCQAPCCATQNRLDSLTHAFLDCPDVKPVIQWMVGVWKSLAGDEAAVPETPAFLLADDPLGWEGAQDPALYRMWTRLRVATLGALWHTRVSWAGALHGASFANSAVRLAVRTLRSAIQRDWMRSGGNARQLQGGSFNGGWWRGFDSSITHSQFMALWARPAIFCRVEEPGATGGRALLLLISDSSPVSVPT